MNKKLLGNELLKGLIPKGLPGLIGLIIIAVLAFSLGGLLSGNGENRMSDGSELRDHSAKGESKPTIWTCSMHPQIQLPKKGKCPICFMDLIPLDSGGGEGLDPRQLKMSATARQIAKIVTSPVRRGPATAEIRITGKLEYNEIKVSYITAWFPGRLDKLYVNFTGTTVKLGERMASIYSPELIATQEELIQAIRAVNSISDGSLILKSTASATLDAARNKLRLFGLSDSQINEIGTLDKIPDHITIYAPAGGVVIYKHANEGMYVKTGMRLYTIADLSELWAYFDAYETDLPWLKLGQDIEFTSLSFPGELFHANIDFIDPILDPKTRTIRVRAIVKNKDGRLKPDMFISGVLKARLNMSGEVVDNNESNENFPLLIPATAPLLTGTRAVVYVELSHDDEALFEGRIVVLGPRAGDFYIVKSGLEEGEMVVTNGAFKIDAELQIQARPSMMLPEGGGRTTVHQNGQKPVAGKESAEHETGYTFGTAERLKINDEAQKALMPVFDNYFEVQMALADDDFEATIEAYKRLLQVINKVDMSLFEGDAHMTWMNISKALLGHSQKGTEAKDIESARIAFYYSSQTAIELHDTFGHAAQKDYFLTYCPMANDNKGAYWLQTVDTVYNSFYGAMMLRCGEIKQKLARGNSEG